MSLRFPGGRRIEFDFLSKLTWLLHHASTLRFLSWRLADVLVLSQLSSESRISVH